MCAGNESLSGAAQLAINAKFAESSSAASATGNESSQVPFLSCPSSLFCLRVCSALLVVLRPMPEHAFAVCLDSALLASRGAFRVTSPRRSFCGLPLQLGLHQISLLVLHPQSIASGATEEDPLAGLAASEQAAAEAAAAQSSLPAQVLLFILGLEPSTSFAAVLHLACCVLFRCAVCSR